MSIDIPVQMTVRKNAHHLQITRMWFERKYVLLAPFVVAWDIFIIWAYKTTFSVSNVDMFVVLFLLLPAALAIVLTYFLIAGFLNKTIIDVTANVISIKHIPLPVWRNKRISANELLQLDCKKEKLRNGIYWIDLISVTAKMNNQNIVTLLSGLKNVEQATFMIQEVQSFLGFDGKAK